MGINVDSQTIIDKARQVSPIAIGVPLKTPAPSKFYVCCASLVFGVSS
jgi:hypothetical protein